MAKPLHITEEMEASLREEAEGLYGSMGWGVPYTPDIGESGKEWFWNELVYEELGYDSCDQCGYWWESNTFYDNICEECYDSHSEEEE